MTMPPLAEELQVSSPQPVATRYAAPLSSCPADLVDGWTVHAAALRCGLNTLLFPGQALMAFPGEEPSAGVAFAHGVPNTTWLSSATLVQDKRMRRDVTAASGVPVPQSRSFTLRRGGPYAKQFAAELGYPVLVKPMIGDSTVEIFPHIADEEQLQAAIDYFRQLPATREAFTTASYAFTQILTAKTAKSTRTRGTYRYLVEEHVAGQHLRLLILEGQVLSAVHLPEDAGAAPQTARDVTGELHPDVTEFARSIADACPGLAVFAADIVVQDYTAPLSDQRHVLTEVSERPWTNVQHQALGPAAHQLGQRLLSHAFIGAGHPAPTPAASAEVSVEFRWEGLSDVDASAEKLAGIARQLGLRGWTEATDPVGGVLTGALTADHTLVALLMEAAVEGHLLGEPVMCAETQATSAVTVETFELRRAAQSA